MPDLEPTDPVGSQRTRSEAINWASVRATGELLGRVIFTDVPVAEARRWQGPAIDSDSMAGVRRDGAIEGLADLELTLAPDLDADDAFVRFLAGMRKVDGIHVMAPASLIERLGSPRGLTTWTVDGDTDGSPRGLRWSEGTRTTLAALAYAANYSEADVVRLYGPKLTSADDVMDHWYAFQAHMARGHTGRIFVTGREAIIASRWEGGVPGHHGQVTPAEAVHIATLIARGRGKYVVGAHAETGSLEMMDPFSWASAAAQALMPAYLGYHGHLVTEVERTAPDRLSLAPSRFALEHLEGIFQWIRLLVLALDRLARAHLREGCIKSNNWTMLQQSDDFVAAVQACAGALEALAGLIAQRAGAVATPRDRKTVSFPSLVSHNKPWAQNLGRYERASSAAAAAAGGSIGLATEIREQGFHQHPLSIRTAAFGRMMEVLVAGRPQARFLEDLTMAAVQPTGEARDPAWATHGEEGVLLQGDAPPYLLPWPYIRSVAVKLARCLNSALNELATVEGAAESQPPLADPGRILLTSLGLSLKS